MKAMKMSRRAERELDARVLALPTTARLAPLLLAATGALSGVRGAPSFEVDLSLQGTWLPPGPLAEANEHKVIAEAFTRNPSALKVVVVEQPLADRWFSHWHAKYRGATVSLADLGALPAVSVEAFVAYELVLHGLRALCADYDPGKLLHPETRACLFDLCQQKAEVAIKLQAGHICDTCLRELSNLGLDRDKVIELWRAVQTLAQSRPSPRP